MPSVRPYRAEDLDPVLDLWHDASKVGHPFLSDEFLTEERQQLAELWLPRSETWVFESDDGRVGGFVSVVGNEVGGLFVAPDLQRQGIGRRLLDHVGASRPLLELDVFEANSVGRSFYEAYGFAVIGRSISGIEGQPELHLRLIPSNDETS